MTKAELLKHLEFIKDDQEVVLSNERHSYEIDHVELGARNQGEESVLILIIGARLLFPKIEFKDVEA